MVLPANAPAELTLARRRTRRKTDRPSFDPRAVGALVALVPTARQPLSGGLGPAIVCLGPDDRGSVPSAAGHRREHRRAQLGWALRDRALVPRRAAYASGDALWPAKLAGMDRPEHDGRPA